MTTESALGRPTEYDEDRVSTTVRLSPALLRRLDDEAKRRELGRNKLVVGLLERALPGYEGESL